MPKFGKGGLNAKLNCNKNSYSKSIYCGILRFFSCTMDAQLKALLTQHMNSKGYKGLQLKQVGVAYSEYAYDAPVKLYGPGYTRNEEGQVPSDEIGNYDYTLPDSPELRTNWYHEPMEKGPIWLEPYWGTTAQAYLAEYFAPYSWYSCEDEGKKTHRYCLRELFPAKPSNQDRKAEYRLQRLWLHSHER